MFGNIGITFKGSGFYRTDSRSDGRKGTQKSAEGEAGEAKAGEAVCGRAPEQRRAVDPSGSSEPVGVVGHRQVRQARRFVRFVERLQVRGFVEEQLVGGVKTAS